MFYQQTEEQLQKLRVKDLKYYQLLILEELQAAKETMHSTNPDSKIIIDHQKKMKDCRSWINQMRKFRKNVKNALVTKRK